MNVFTAIGRVGRDAVIRSTTAGKSVLGWSLAVDSGYGDKKQTVWVDCSLWGERAAKIADYIKKGDRLGVTGELGTREHEGKTYVTLRVADVTLLGTKPAAGSKPATQGTTGAPAGEFDDDLSDVPF